MKLSPMRSCDAKPLLDTPEAATATPENDVERGGLDDRPGVQAVLGGEAGVADAVQTVGTARQPLVALVGLERVATRLDEGERPVELGARQAGVGRACPHLGEEVVWRERRGAGARHDMLRQNVDPAGAEAVDVELVVGDGVAGGERLEIFEAVARHDDRLARLVHPVVGAADALEQAARPLRRAHLDDEVDVAPVDAEVEARSSDDRPQAARRHRRLDLAPRLGTERAVVDADRQRGVVSPPTGRGRSARRPRGC